jgi:hypothetical protein
MGATEIGVGFSHHRNPKAAGKEAAEQALKKGGIDKPDFVLMFATAGYEQEAIVRAVREATSNAPLSGCSGEGIITNGHADETPFGVTVMTIKSDEIKFSHALTEGVKDKSDDAGRLLGNAIRGSVTDSTAAMILMTDGVSINFDAFRKGMDESLGLKRRIPVFGGMAGDAMEWKQTHQYCDDRVISGGAACVAISGSVNVAYGIDAGCVPPVGAPHVITKCKGNVVFEIDGEPATDWLKKYLSQDKSMANKELTSVLVLAFAFKAEGELMQLGDFFVRGLPAKDEVAKSLTLFTEVKEGTEFWLTRRDPEIMLNGVEKLGTHIKAQLEGRKPKMVLQFDCAGRGKFMLQEQERNKLVTSLQSKVGSDAPWIGFYTYGEIGPVAGATHFHNYTVVLAALS